MAEIKWIKLAADIFDNRKIKQIEALPDGDAIVVIWIKILCLAGTVNDGGQIYITREIPYTEEMMATQFGRPLNTVRAALRIFERFGMISTENDILRVSNWEKYQSIEGLERVREQTRRRVQRFRERETKALAEMPCTYCGEPATGYDHILAISRGGKDEQENKIPCCRRCNQKKNDKPVVDFLNRYPELIRRDLVDKNEKLARFVSFCNATNRYIVTQSNALDIESESEKEKERNIKEIAEPLASAPPASAPKPEKPQKHQHGEYKNVLLTDAELAKLSAEYPNDYKERIEALSRYMKSTGKAYKDHLATIRNWARRDGVPKATKPEQNIGERSASAVDYNAGANAAIYAKLAEKKREENHG